MQSEKISCLNRRVLVEGVVHTSSGRKRIDLKAPIKNMFEDMGLDKDKVAYVMEQYFNKYQLNQRIEELSDENVIPVILYFVKKKSEILV